MIATLLDLGLWIAVATVLVSPFALIALISGGVDDD
jgi:hypothetical protein